MVELHAIFFQKKESREATLFSWYYLLHVPLRMDKSSLREKGGVATWFGLIKARKIDYNISYRLTAEANRNARHYYIIEQRMIGLRLKIKLAAQAAWPA